MSDPQGSYWRRGWLALAVAVLGLALSISLAARLKAQAEAAWEAELNRTGAALSVQVVDLLRRAEQPLLDVAIPFADPLPLARPTFLHTLDILDSRDQDFVPISAALLVQAPDAPGSFHVDVSTDLTGVLDDGGMLGAQSVPAEIAALALTGPGEVFLSSVEPRPDLSGIAYVALAPPAHSATVLVLSFDIVDLMRGLHASSLPTGLGLQLSLRGAERPAHESPRDVLVAAVSEGSVVLRGSVEQLALNASLELEWQATRAYAGGPDLALSRAVLGGGALVSLLVAGLIAFLLLQYRQIEARVAEAASSSHEALVAAEQGARAKATFLATMSHEIRTPLNGVVGMVDLLDDTRLTNEQQDMVGTIRQSSLSLLTIINDILDYSKIEAGKLEIESVPIALLDIVESSVQALLPIADGKGLRMSAFVDPAIPARVLGDAVRLRQVLFNLAGNAVKFTNKGEVVVRADLEGRAENGELRVRFSVRDTGIGISAQARSKLFTAFNQAEPSTTRRYGGTGLGLSICMRLADLMGGVIEVDSTPGVGSEFAFVVNLRLPDAAALAALPPIPSPVLDGLTVLVVESEPAMADLLASYLVADSIVVRRCTAEGVEDALASSQRLDVVALMPGIDAATVKSMRLDQMAQSIGIVLPMNLLQARPGLAHRRLAVPLALIPLRRAKLREALAQSAGRVPLEDDVIATNATLLDGLGDDMTPDDAAPAPRLLVAEDNPINQKVISRQLAQLGYEFDIVDDGQQALEALEQSEYGLLLTDCHMPVMDGFELVSRIRDRERQGRSRLGVVAVTASAMNDEVKRCLDSGMDGVVAKPVEIARLRECIERVCGAA